MTMVKKMKGIGLISKLSIFFTLFGLVIVAIFYGVFRLLIIPTIENNYLSRLKDIVVIAASQIDIEDHERIVTYGLGEDSVEYKRIDKILKKIAEVNPQIDSIYTLVQTREPGIAKFVVDSFTDFDLNSNGMLDPDEVHAQVGEIYDYSDIDVFRRGFYAPSADLKPYTDKWGTYITAVAPLKNSKGALVGELAADITYEEFSSMINEFTSKVYLIFILVVLFMFLLGYLIGRVVVRKVREVIDTILRMTDSDSVEYLKVNTGDEIATVFTMINEMVRDLRSSRENMSMEVKRQTEELQNKLTELEKLNKLMVGRELVMAELKKQIKEINGKSKS